MAQTPKTVRAAALSVRRAKATDLDSLIALFEDYLRFYGQPVIRRRVRAFLQARLRRRDALMLLACRAAQPVGFAQIYPSLCSLAQQPIGILYDLYVATAARRQGVGRTLLQAAAQHARRFGAVRLELATAITNHKAQHLYAAEGYRRDRRFHHYALDLTRRTKL